MAGGKQREQICRCPLCGPAGCKISHTLAVNHAKAQRGSMSSAPWPVTAGTTPPVSSRRPATFILPPPTSDSNKPPSNPHGVLTSSILSLPSDRAVELLRELYELHGATYTRRLQFLGDPVSIRHFRYATIEDFWRRSSDSPHDLLPGVVSNQLILRDENRIREAAAEIGRWHESSNKQRVSSILLEAWWHLQMQKALAWFVQRDAHNDSIVHTGEALAPMISS